MKKQSKKSDIFAKMKMFDPKSLNKELESIQEEVRQLRDSDNHVCPFEKDSSKKCTCYGYDLLIDHVEKLKL